MSNCVLCHNELKQGQFKSEIAITSDHKILRQNLTTEYCNYCGIISIKSKDEFNDRRFYEKYYDIGYNELFEPTIIKNDEIVSHYKYLVDFSSSHIAVGFNKKMIDIGRGKGGFLRAFRDKYPIYELFGIEPALNQDDELLEPSNTYIGFLEESPYLKDKFDFISLINVLEHIENPVVFLNYISKMMHSDSVLLIEVPNFKNNKADILNMDHRIKYIKESISNLFKVIGFKIVKEEVPDNAVAMRFLLKKCDSEPIKNIDPTIHVLASIKYIERIKAQTKFIKPNEKMFVYGFGSIYLYLNFLKLIKEENIVAFVNDNPAYWNKEFQGRPIISHENMAKYDSNVVLLAMNECYHSRVIPKIKGYKIIGC